MNMPQHIDGPLVYAAPAKEEVAGTRLRSTLNRLAALPLAPDAEDGFVRARILVRDLRWHGHPLFNEFAKAASKAGYRLGNAEGLNISYSENGRTGTIQLVARHLPEMIEKLRQS